MKHIKRITSSPSLHLQVLQIDEFNHMVNVRPSDDIFHFAH
jgi:hypothetical protein